MLAHGVCCQQPFSSAGRGFAACRSRLNVYGPIRSFPRRTKNNSIKNFVNWIPANTHVRSNKTQPYLTGLRNGTYIYSLRRRKCTQKTARKRGGEQMREIVCAVWVNKWVENKWVCACLFERDGGRKWENRREREERESMIEREGKTEKERAWEVVWSVGWCEKGVRLGERVCVNWPAAEASATKAWGDGRPKTPDRIERHTRNGPWTGNRSCS